ncbi:hypothetical protein J4447_00135 [Candidatus Pacearchaeota archaeon]|nr:hypothetical protein [Candidatus Pacearchaeota archaeon]
MKRGFNIFKDIFKESCKKKAQSTQSLLPWIIAAVVLAIVLYGVFKFGLFDKFINAVPSAPSVK